MPSRLHQRHQRDKPRAPQGLGGGGLRGGSQPCRRSLSFVGCLGLAWAGRGYPGAAFCRGLQREVATCAACPGADAGVHCPGCWGGSSGTMGGGRGSTHWQGHGRTSPAGRISPTSMTCKQRLPSPREHRYSECAIATKCDESFDQHPFVVCFSYCMHGSPSTPEGGNPFVVKDRVVAVHINVHSPNTMQVGRHIAKG